MDTFDFSRMADALPSDEDTASLCEAFSADRPCRENDELILANLMILKRRGARHELNALNLTTLEIRNRAQQVAFLKQTTQAVARSQQRLD